MYHCEGKEGMEVPPTTWLNTGASKEANVPHSGLPISNFDSNGLHSVAVSRHFPRSIARFSESRSEGYGTADLSVLSPSKFCFAI